MREEAVDKMNDALQEYKIPLLLRSIKKRLRWLVDWPEMLEVPKGDTVGLFAGARRYPPCGFSGWFASFAPFGCLLVFVGVPVMYD